LPQYQVTLKERSPPHRALDLGRYNVPTERDAVKRAKNHYKGLERRLEMGDSAWEWSATLSA
jgi:hypothetical protein